MLCTLTCPVCGYTREEDLPFGRLTQPWCPDPHISRNRPDPLSRTLLTVVENLVQPRPTQHVRIADFMQSSPTYTYSSAAIGGPSTYAAYVPPERQRGVFWDMVGDQILGLDSSTPQVVWHHGVDDSYLVHTGHLTFPDPPAKPQAPPTQQPTTTTFTDPITGNPVIAEARGGTVPRTGRTFATMPPEVPRVVPEPRRESAETPLGRRIRLDNSPPLPHDSPFSLGPSPLHALMREGSSAGEMHIVPTTVSLNMRLTNVELDAFTEVLEADRQDAIQQWGENMTKTWGRDTSDES